MNPTFRPGGTLPVCPELRASARKIPTGSGVQVPPSLLDARAVSGSSSLRQSFSGV
jgi:hypothetical protein